MKAGTKITIRKAVNLDQGRTGFAGDVFTVGQDISNALASALVRRRFATMRPPEPKNEGDDKTGGKIGKGKKSEKDEGNDLL